MPRILMTGAAGGIGTSLRKLLPPIYPDLVLNDLKAPADLGREIQGGRSGRSRAGRGDLRRRRRHPAFRRLFRRRPLETIFCKSNIIGCYNLFEAARKKGVKRVVFASSNHAVGFIRATTVSVPAVTARPDSRYGVSKVFGEAVDALYADKVWPWRYLYTDR